jgi:hypothetical protein
MVIPEDTESRYLYDYHQRTLYIFENDVLKLSKPFSEMKLRITGVPFDLIVQNTCSNCAIVKRANEGNYHGMAKFMALESTPPSKEPEADLPGLTFTIAGLKDQDGTYIAFEGMPEPITLYANEKEYKLIFGKRQSMLPFTIRLSDFDKEIYPGTDKARGYSSDIVIVDNGLEWPAPHRDEQATALQGLHLLSIVLRTNRQNAGDYFKRRRKQGTPVPPISVR